MCRCVDRCTSIHTQIQCLVCSRQPSGGRPPGSAERAMLTYLRDGGGGARPHAQTRSRARRPDQGRSWGVSRILRHWSWGVKAACLQGGLEPPLSASQPVRASFPPSPPGAGRLRVPVAGEGKAEGPSEEAHGCF